LRLRLALAVEGEELVVDHEAVIADEGGGRLHRVEAGEVVRQDDAEGLRGSGQGEQAERAAPARSRVMREGAGIGSSCCGDGQRQSCGGMTGGKGG
jgi:hypothetical protein